MHLLFPLDTKSWTNLQMHQQRQLSNNSYPFFNQDDVLKAGLGIMSAPFHTKAVSVQC